MTLDRLQAAWRYTNAEIWRPNQAIGDIGRQFMTARTEDRRRIDRHIHIIDLPGAKNSTCINRIKVGATDVERNSVASVPVPPVKRSNDDSARAAA